MTNLPPVQELSEAAMKEVEFAAAGGAMSVSPHYSDPLPPTVGALFAKASFTTSESSPDRPGLRLTFGFHDSDEAHAAQDEIIRLVQIENSRRDGDERSATADVSGDHRGSAGDQHSGAGVSGAGLDQVAAFWNAYKRHLPAHLRPADPPPEVRKAIDAGLSAALLTELQHSRAAEAAAPEGWVLVPRVMTPEMHLAWQRLAATDYTISDIDRAYDAMLSASPASPSATGVRVKALEWQEFKNQHGTTVRANGIFGWLHYIADRDADGRFPGEGWHSVLGYFDTLDAAKAAAQSDYEQRVLPALVEQP